MLTACWSVKGGSGTTVFAAALATSLAAVGRSVLAVDFGGDLPIALGVPQPIGPGLSQWIEAGPEVPADGIDRIAHHLQPGIDLVPRGTPSSDALADGDGGRRLARALRASHASGPIVVDCGSADSPAPRAVVEAADRSLLVVRNCYLALERARHAPRPTAVVLVNEPSRALRAADVEASLGVPVATEVDWDPAVARAVDTGLLATRMPRRLAHALREIAA